MILHLILTLALAAQSKSKPANALTTYKAWADYRELMDKLEDIDTYPEAFFEQAYFRELDKKIEDLRQQHTQDEVDAIEKSIDDEIEHFKIYDGLVQEWKII